MRAYWYLRLAEIAWQLTAAPEKSVPLLQGQATELKLQIQQITTIAAQGQVDNMVFDDPTDRPSKKVEEVNQRLKSENATMETEVKENIIEASESSLDTNSS